MKELENGFSGFRILFRKDCGGKVLWGVKGCLTLIEVTLFTYLGLKECKCPSKY